MGACQPEADVLGLYLYGLAVVHLGHLIKLAVELHSSPDGIASGMCGVEVYDAVDVLHRLLRTAVVVVHQCQSQKCLFMVGVEAQQVLIVSACILQHVLPLSDVSAHEQGFGVVWVFVEDFVVVGQCARLVAHLQIERGAVQQQSCGAGCQQQCLAVVLHGFIFASCALSDAGQMAPDDDIALCLRRFLQRLTEQLLGQSQAVILHGCDSLTYQ